MADATLLLPEFMATSDCSTIPAVGVNVAFVAEPMRVTRRPFATVAVTDGVGTDAELGFTEPALTSIGLVVSTPT